MEKKDETIPGQMSILDLIEEEPQSFGACKWDRQHEWDSCEAWEQDKSVLKEEKG